MIDYSQYTDRETGGRLATIQPGISGWYYVHYIDNREFAAWFRAGVKLDGRQVDWQTMKAAVIARCV